MQGITLCIFVIGCQMAFQSKNIIVVIVSIAIGTVIGEILDIDRKLQQFGNWVEVKMVGKRNTGTAGAIGEGFIAASLIYCIGAMAILGSIQDGLTGDHQILFAKSTLDGMTAIIFTANLGVGVGLSAVSVLIYQGLITILASHLQSFMTPALMAARIGDATVAVTNKAHVDRAVMTACPPMPTRFAAPSTSVSTTPSRTTLLARKLPLISGLPGTITTENFAAPLPMAIGGSSGTRALSALATTSARWWPP